MVALLPLLLAASIDGEAALLHARRLAALGPHPWGTTLNKEAARYVESQFRDVGLSEVRFQSFERDGLIGTNVVGVLRANGPEFLVVGAHHDSAPGAPGMPARWYQIGQFTYPPGELMHYIAMESHISTHVEAPSHFLPALHNRPGNESCLLRESRRPWSESPFCFARSRAQRFESCICPEAHGW